MLKGACKLASYQDGHAISHDLCKVHGITFPSLQVAGRESRIPLKGYYEWHIPDDDGSSPALCIAWDPETFRNLFKRRWSRKPRRSDHGQSGGALTKYLRFRPTGQTRHDSLAKGLVKVLRVLHESRCKERNSFMTRESTSTGSTSLWSRTF